MAKETIVVVDDEAPARNAVARILKASGYNVHVMGGGQEAIDFAMANSFDVLLTDFRMPGGLDGLTTVRAIRKINPQVVALIMTGNNSVDLAIQSLNLGIHGFVVKPFTAYDLIRTIEQTIERQQLILENIKMRALVDVFEATKALITADNNPTHLPGLAVEQALNQTNASEALLFLTGDNSSASTHLELAGVITRGPDGEIWADEPALYGRTRPEELKSVLETAQRALAENKNIFLVDNREIVIDTHLIIPAPKNSCKLIVPMLAQGRQVGVLYTARNGEGPGFTEVDLRTLVILASQAAVAIDNTRLYRRLARIEALREADRLRSEFVATVSHELRTPLTSIKGYATTLLRSDVQWNERVGRDYLSIISEECDKLMQLIDNILEVSKIEAGVLRIFPETVQINEIAQRAILEAQRRYPEATFNLVCPNADALPFVKADPQRIIQVLRNLIDNAIKYSPNDQTVEIKVGLPLVEKEATPAQAQSKENTPEGSGSSQHWIIVVSVKDRGQGLKAEDQEKIFERFYRVDNGSSRRTEGTGLGLAICHGIIQAHHGKIWAESAGLGKGSTFSFTLPVAEGIDQIELD